MPVPLIIAHLVGSVGLAALGGATSGPVSTILSGMSGNEGFKVLLDAVEETAGTLKHPHNADLGIALSAAITEARRRLLNSARTEEERSMLNFVLASDLPTKELLDALLQKDDLAVRKAFWSRLDTPADSTSPQPAKFALPPTADFTRFVQDHEASIPRTVVAAFGDVLKENTHARAWIAYNYEMLGRIYEHVKQLPGAPDLARLEALLAQPEQLARSTAEVLSTAQSGVELQAKQLQSEEHALANLIAKTIQMLAVASGRFIKDSRAYTLPRQAHDKDLIGRLIELPFAGRDQVLEDLTSLTAKPGGYCLITAPAGSGKSTLLAHWLRALSSQHTDIRVSYHFFTTTTPDVTAGLVCLGEQLLGAHGIEGTLRGKDPIEVCDIVDPFVKTAKRGVLR